MKQKAVVIETHGDKATVSVLREEACAHCAGRVVCGTARTMTASVENPIGARVGDSVIVESADNSPLLYMALIFLAPVVLGMLLYIAFMNISIVLAVIMGMIGFAVPFIAVTILSRNEGIIPKIYIREILPREEETPPCDKTEGGS